MCIKVDLVEDAGNGLSDLALLPGDAHLPPQRFQRAALCVRREHVMFIYQIQVDHKPCTRLLSSVTRIQIFRLDANTYKLVSFR